MEDGAEGEGGQGDAEQVFAAADQGEDGMQQAERIKRGGHAQPDDAHFSHGVVFSVQYIASPKADRAGSYNSRRCSAHYLPGYSRFAC